MHWIIVGFGVLMITVGICGVIRPAALLNVARDIPRTTGLMVAAVLGRLVLGAVLILAAEQTRYPTAFIVIGVVVIVAALAIVLMGRTRFFALVDYFLNISSAWIRLPALMAVGVGGFFIYAAI
jgi:hypothetical protein